MQWRFRSFGGVALRMCLLELVAIWGTVMIVFHTPQHSFDGLIRPLAIVYVGGLISIPISVIGLLKDKDRTWSFVALVLGFANIFVCVVPFIPY